MDAMGIMKSGGRCHGNTAGLALSVFQLAQLLKAGVGIADALDDVLDMESVRCLRRVWSDLSVNVKSGRCLSDGMSRWPQVFDATVIALIKAAERSGELAPACMSVHEYLRWHSQLRNRLATILVYPLFSLLVLLAVTGFLFVAVVPAVKDYLLAGEAVLAWHTLSLIALADWLKASYVLLITSFVAVFFIAVLAVRYSQKVRWFLHAVSIRLPVLGGLIVDLSLSRYAQCSARLYGSGISLDECLKLSENTVGNCVLKQQLINVREAMVRGQSLAISLEEHRDIPAFFRRMVSVGEATGTLENALLQLSVQQQQASDATIERVEQLIAPVMLLFIGSSLLWIVVSMLSPVYSTAINSVLLP